VNEPFYVWAKNTRQRSLLVIAREHAAAHHHINRSDRVLTGMSGSAIVVSGGTRSDLYALLKRMSLDSRLHSADLYFATPESLDAAQRNAARSPSVLERFIPKWLRG